VLFLFLSHAPKYGVYFDLCNKAAIKYKLHKLILLLGDLEKMAATGQYFKAVKQWKPIIDAVDEIKNSGLG